MFVETDEDLLPIKKPHLIVVSEPESGSRLEITISWRSPLWSRAGNQTFQLTRKGYKEFLVELTRIERNLAASVWLIFFF
jgi:hypothetical protein